jgi:ribosomal 50S subunit-recycling heat shock protein
MRLDLFLKWSRLILRRSLAKDTCDAGRVRVNGSPARAGRELKAGDVVDLDMPRRRMKVRVLAIPARSPSKEDAREMVEILEDARISSGS